MNAMALVLKRIVWPDGSRRPDDFNIMHDGEVVGRLYRVNGAPRDLWRWTRHWYTGGPNGGVADTLEQANGFPLSLGCAAAIAAGRGKTGRASATIFATELGSTGQYSSVRGD
jgi:hypothetical protein